jgi:hypothetical protein
LSPQELRAKYTVALGRIGGKSGAEGVGRRKPIYERNVQIGEQQAIAEAASALTALWNIRRTEKA